MKLVLACIVVSLLIAQSSFALDLCAASDVDIGRAAQVASSLISGGTAQVPGMTGAEVADIMKALSDPRLAPVFAEISQQVSSGSLKTQSEINQALINGIHKVCGK